MCFNYFSFIQLSGRPAGRPAGAATHGTLNVITFVRTTAKSSGPTKVITHEGFTHESLYPRRFLRTKAFTHEGFYAPKLFPRKVIPSKVITFRVRTTAPLLCHETAHAPIALQQHKATAAACSCRKQPKQPQLLDDCWACWAQLLKSFSPHVLRLKNGTVRAPGKINACFQHYLRE